MKRLFNIVATLLLVAALYIVATGESPLYQLNQLIPAAQAAPLPAGVTEVPPSPISTEVVLPTQPVMTAIPQQTVQIQTVTMIASITTLPSGRTIDVYQSGTGTQVILVIGNIHGGNEQNTYTLVQQLMQSINDGSIVIPSSVTVYMVPTMNPDGLSLGISSGGRFNSNNVDLNRNWESNNWRSDSYWGNTRTFGGNEPFSEIESQTIRDLILLLQPKTTVFFHCCIGNGVVYANDSAVANGSEAAFRSGGGYSYNAGEARVTGDAIDWMNQVPQLPGFEVELPVSTHQRTIDWDHNQRALQALFNWAANMP